MTPISPVDRACLYIREQVEGGIVLPGQRLSRRTLAQTMGVSEAVILKAFAQLERDGMIESRSRSGTYVREVGIEEYVHLCNVRELIEPYAAACAAELITEEQLEILQRSCQRYQQLCDSLPLPMNATTAWLQRCQAVQEELLFHNTILKAAGNPLLEQCASMLRLINQVKPEILFSDGTSKGISMFITVYEHEGITQALADHDAPLAQERMLHHLRGARIPLDPAHALKVSGMGSVNVSD
ncbi:MAG: GntR family transcriptional regulator [Planctomycetota bacterium]